MITYISTKDTAKLVRQALRNAFPGQKFSVRCSTGTAAAWMDVTWIDGPTTRQVDGIVGLPARPPGGAANTPRHPPATCGARKEPPWPSGLEAEI